jgi:hypothetical protein
MLECAYCHRSYSADQIGEADWTCPMPLNQRGPDGRCYFRS